MRRFCNHLQLLQRHLPVQNRSEHVLLPYLQIAVRRYANVATADPDTNKSRATTHLVAVLGAASACVYGAFRSAQCEQQEASKQPSELPSYSRAEVSKHRTPESRIWVTHGDSVYDITDFIALHPGGAQRIMLAAGGSLEPFWGVYQQHNKTEVRDILDGYKIGKLSDAVKTTENYDAYKNDPERHPALITLTEKPRNAETPAALLAGNFITPTDLFFVRNHLPVPEVEASTYKLVVEGQGARTLELSLSDLKTKFKKHTITATLQCSGNRRHDMNVVKPIKGLDWRVGGISTATFSGVRLRDVLKAAGLNDDDPNVQHIQFVGLDSDPATNTQYGASIPVQKAMSHHGDVILAYEMNGEPLTRDHGYPLRVVVPGTTAARSVKWLTKIIPSPEESQSHWQQKDYKSFNPHVDWDTVDWASAPAIQEVPVTSAITEPEEGAKVTPGASVTVKGYAWSGGGRGVIRVDVSLDGGRTWEVADIKHVPGQQDPYSRAWAWSLWEASLRVPKDHQGPLQVVCKATDGSYNSQPDTVPPIWNLRGVVNNAWHRVNVDVA